MRFGPLVPPVIALALAGIWLAHKNQSISTVEDATAVLKKHLATARTVGTSTDPTSAKPTIFVKATKDARPVEWEKVAAQFVGRQTGRGDIDATFRFEADLVSMSTQEIIAGLDEIFALGHPAESNVFLENLLITWLWTKDPELALTRYTDRLHDDSDRISQMLSGTMLAWAKRDLAKATTWFDRQIAAGKFDNKSLLGISKSRIKFEGDLIKLLLVSDPTAVVRRLDVMTVHQQAEVLSQHFGKEQARAVAATVTDPTRREEILKKLN